MRGCSLVAIERLSTLTSTGRGNGVPGRWRLLKYQCLRGHALAHHPAPRHRPALPPLWPSRSHRSLPGAAGHGGGRGRWLWRGACGSNADRDDAAARTSARLGVTDLAQMSASSTAKRSVGGERVVTPVAYTGAGAGLPLPPPGFHARPQGCGKDRLLSCPILSDPGRFKTAYLQSAQPPPTFLRLCG